MPEYRYKLYMTDATILLITPNLDTALRRIRLPDRIRALWVDAICINQQDVAERGGQVQLMGSIYSKARQVIVWLGKDEDDCAEETFTWLR